MARVEGETYFNNFEQSGYDELKSWTPEFYQKIKEADANLRFAGQTVDLMAENLEKWCRNMFVDTMDEPMILRMERFLKIPTEEGKSLDDRRKMVRLVWTGGDKFCGAVIKRMVKQYTECDGEPSVTFDNKLRVRAQLTEQSRALLEDLHTFFNKLTPAHIEIDLGLSVVYRIAIRTTSKVLLFPYRECGTFLCGEEAL